MVFAKAVTKCCNEQKHVKFSSSDRNLVLHNTVYLDVFNYGRMVDVISNNKDRCSFLDQ
jgi:hypothetical protein